LSAFNRIERQIMRRLLVVISALLLPVAAAVAGPETAVKDKAQSLTNSGTAGQRPAPPAGNQATNTKSMTSHSPKLTPEQEAFLRFRFYIDLVPTNAPVTEDHRMQLERGLMEVSYGKTKPSEASVKK